MGNFVVEFKKGQEGGNKGLPIAKLTKLSNAINGIQKGKIYEMAGRPKRGEVRQNGVGLGMKTQ